MGNKFWNVVLLGVLLMSAILEITDGTVANTVDLLSPVFGFHLDRWRPALQAYKGDGVWHDSALSDGRRLADSKWTNVIETMDLKANDLSEDMLIADHRKIRGLLESAADYWKAEWQDTPVYLKARGPNETNTRYAIIYNGRIPEDEMPAAAPWLQDECMAVADNLTLLVEHGPWLETPPGTGTCVQVSGQQAWDPAATQITSSPAQSTDDVECSIGGGNFATGAVGLYLGNEAVIGIGPALVGIRFPAIAVPPGAIILKSKVTFRGIAADVNDDCYVMIRGEATDDAPTFSTEQNLRTRAGDGPFYSVPPPVTEAYTLWPPDAPNSGIEHWAIGVNYDTPPLNTIIQEIVDRTGWVSGNDLVLFFYDYGSTPGVGASRSGASWDHATAPAPLLRITYAVPAPIPGRAATCNNEVFIANKHNRAQLTDVYRRTAAGAFSANLVGTTAYNLFPTSPIATGEIVYFGIDTAMNDSGPFDNLIFDIGTPAAYIGAPTIAWQYWNGGWVAIPAASIQDNTDGGQGTFSASGVNGVHWTPPADWAATAINGITAFWVRALATIGGGESITNPAQQNRTVYTTVWPFVELAADQVPGDLTAALRIRIMGQSGGIYPTKLARWTNRLLIGTRSVGRGEDFTAFINLGDEQNPAGVYTWVGANTTFANAIEAPSGRYALYNPAGVEALAARITVTFNREIYRQYYGTYRLFLRAYQSGGVAADFSIRVVAAFGGRVLWTSATKATPNTYDWQVYDFGQITIPFVRLRTDEYPLYGTNFIIQASAGNAAANLYFYDLVFIPTDEWAADAYTAATSQYFSAGLGRWADTLGRTYLDLDNITTPKYLRSSVIESLHGDAVAVWPVITPERARIQANEPQRIWFFSVRRVHSTNEWRAEPNQAHSIQVYRQARYYSMRGST